MRGSSAKLTTTEYPVADWAEGVEAYFERGWTDGLPVVPATEDAVRRFLEAAGREPGDGVITEPVRRPTITTVKIAINAVLAGCLPEYMPVILTALDAMGDPIFTLHGAITSTGGSATLVVVNGPIRQRLGFNSGTNVFGPGWRANATVGRAIRLITLNCLGAQPGVLDKSTQGHPGKYSYCIAENAEENPWEPLHVERDVARAMRVPSRSSRPSHRTTSQATTVRRRTRSSSRSSTPWRASAASVPASHSSSWRPSTSRSWRATARPSRASRRSSTLGPAARAPT